MPKSTRDELASRRAMVADFLLKGHTHQSIADRVGVSRSQVTKDVGTIRRGWVDTAILNYDQHLAQELRRLDAVAAAAWEGWKASKGPEGDKAGSVAHLNVILRAHERVCSLTGIEAARRIEVSGPDSPLIDIEDAKKIDATFYVDDDDDTADGWT